MRKRQKKEKERKGYWHYTEALFMTHATQEWMRGQEESNVT